MSSTTKTHDAGIATKVICDPFQSIYDFRGGVTEELIAFGETFDEHDRLPEDAYSPAVTAWIYATLADKARRVVAAGHSAVVDAVFARPQERMVMAAHKLQGLTLVARIRINGWAILVLTKAPATADVFRLGSRGTHAAGAAEIPSARPAAMAG